MSGSKVVITADSAQAIREFDRFRSAATGSLQQVSDLGGKLKGMLAAVGVGLSVNAMVGIVKSSIEAAAGMHDLSIQTGASVASLMAFKSVAATSETTIDGIGNAMNKLAKGMAGASEESAGVGAAVRALGLNFEELKKEAPDQQMLDVAEALDKFRDGAGKSAVAMTLFGKEGAKMLPFLQDLADESDAVRAKLTAQQVEMKRTQAAMADDFSDNLTKIKKAGESWKKDIAMGMLPALYELSGAFYKVSNSTSGLKGKITNLSQDGSFAQWTRVAITGATYLLDAVEGIGRLVQALGKSIGATLALTFESVAGGAKAMRLFVEGEYSESWATIRATAANAGTIFKSFGEDVAETFSQQSFGAKIREGMDSIRKTGVAAKEAKEALNFDASADADNAAAIKKEKEAFAGLIATIRAKREEDQLELATSEAATEGQKLRIKVEQELASGKLKLSEAHIAVVRAALDELDATEELVKAQKAEKDGMAWMRESAQTRVASSAALEVEYAMYGKTADAREIAMIAVKAEADLEKFLLEERKKGITIGEQLEAQLRAEKDMRVEVEQATMAQTKALAAANSLADENRRFAAESIFDERERAAALLEIDADLWKERIRLAGDGTEAQKLLQKEFETWYRNQQMKPQIEEQRKMWESVEQTAHDTFISIFDSGKSAFDRLRDALKNGLLDLLYQMTVKKWIISVGATVGYGSVGAAEAGSQAGIAGSSPLINAVATASNLYKAMSGGFASIGATLGGMVSGVGNLVGSSTMSAFGAGMGMTGAQAAEAAALYNGAGMGGVGTALNAGSMAGAAAGIGAGVLGGVYGGRLISGGYGSNGAVNTGTAIGAAVGSVVPVIGTAIGALVGGLLGGVYNRAFGHKGPEVESQGLSGSFSDGTVTGQSYQNILEKGGWFSSDKRYADVQAFTDDMSKRFAEGFTAIKKSAIDFGKSIGVSTDSLDHYSKTFDVKLSSDQAANEKAITDFFTGVSDEIARQLVPNLDTFTKAGESATAALQRLAGEFQSTDKVAQLLGHSAVDVFGATGLSSTAARERLIDLAGGVDVLGQQAQFYAQNFLSDGERLAPVSAALDAALASLGLATIPTTRTEFKKLIDDLIKTGAIATDAGAKQFASLMALQEAFAQVYPEIDQTVSTLTGARQALTEAYQTESDAIKATTDRMSSFAANLRTLRESSLLGSLSPLTPQQKYAEARAEYERVLAAARAGDTTAQGQYQDAYNAFLTASQTVNASGAQYQRDFAYAQQQTEEALQWAEQQVDIGQASLDALKLQVTGLIDVKNEVKTVKQAIDNLIALMGSSGSAAAGASQRNAIESLYESLLGRTADAAGMQFWQNSIAAGASISDIAKAITQSDEYQGLSSIVAASASPVNYGAMAAVDVSQVVAGLAQVRDEVAKLRSDQDQQTGDLIAANAAAAASSANTIADATVQASSASQQRDSRVMPA